ncbi:C2 domain-containing protein 5 isoform X4 [Octopus sinensis]|uniref:C2 domain-containing protein 5 isoform X4 n=1 Tax=Octopus sinensis TaxID=2607531 RepID=A0A6P7SJR0_9MOLL|nr:C2 domain-containing protein 5 isoform X4 [Octopus sinensis]
MPGRLKVKVVAARDLPIMDRASDLTDAFVEVRFGNDIFKTDVCRKSLNPQWNSDWFKFEVEDEALQDEPLILRVLDYDTYSAHDSIGKVYIDLNPLLIKNNPSLINGWFPIYDTMRGIRGELNFIVKVDLFSDFNRFRQSSCGVQLFCSAAVPEKYMLQSLHGFVEELVVNDDPEYQWIDKLRTPRASNEARQRLFSKLSGELQRKIGLKVLELGGNSVIGYRQCFDLEGESGIVVRAIGTAVTLSKSLVLSTSPMGLSPFKDSPLPEDIITPSSPTINQSGGLKSSTSPAKCSSTAIRRRSSDSDLSTTPKEVSPGPPPPGGSLTGSSGSGSGTGVLSGISGRAAGHKPGMPQQQPTIDMLEYPFFTMKTFPPAFIVHLGGVVSAKSVKLLDKIHNPDEPETRDAWWIEIRTEIRSHCRSMGCHAVIGYSEMSSICDEVIILSAIGTAAVISSNMDVLLPVVTQKDTAPLYQSTDKVPVEKEKLYVDVNLANQMSQNSIEEGFTPANCVLCHIPYKTASMPFKVTLDTCTVCHKHPVPDVLFTTINPPEEIQTIGKGTLIQARIYRAKKEGKGEACAKEISDCLPFMEYELHNQLINKLKMRGMNGLFGLVVHITVGETMLAGIATATAAYLNALPAPSVPRISGQVMPASDNNDLEKLQQRLTTTVQNLKEQYEIFVPEITPGQSSLRCSADNTDDSDEDQSDLELSFGNKDTFVLEVDDAKDETVSLILDDFTAPEGFEICNTEVLPGVTNIVCNLQMFTHVWRGKCQKIPMTVKDFSDLFNHLIRKICFKLRKMAPCCLSCLDFNLELADEDEVQITLTGMCTGLGEVQPQASKNLVYKTNNGSNLLLSVPSNSSCDQDHDLMFQMEEVQESPVTSKTSQQAQKTGKTESGLKYHTLPRHRLGVELIPMSYVPGGKIDHYLGSYNFFFIRESTSVREMGGACGFMQSFVSEVKAIVRAHVGALGGNAMVAYKMNECILLNNPHKNQCQCLINVSGDAVSVLYGLELPFELANVASGTLSVSRGDVSQAQPSGSGNNTLSTNSRPVSDSPVIS